MISRRLLLALCVLLGCEGNKTEGPVPAALDAVASSSSPQGAYPEGFLDGVRLSRGEGDVPAVPGGAVSLAFDGRELRVVGPRSEIQRIRVASRRGRIDDKVVEDNVMPALSRAVAEEEAPEVVIYADAEASFGTVFDLLATTRRLSVGATPILALAPVPSEEHPVGRSLPYLAPRRLDSTPAGGARETDHETLTLYISRAGFSLFHGADGRTPFPVPFARCNDGTKGACLKDAEAARAIDRYDWRGLHEGVVALRERHAEAEVLHVGFARELPVQVVVTTLDVISERHPTADSGPLRVEVGAWGGVLPERDFTKPRCDGRRNRGSRYGKEWPEEVKSPKARLKPMRPEISGELESREVRRALNQHSREITACYEAELEDDPELYGKIEIAFVISDQGQVVSAEIMSNKVHDAVGSCLVEKLRSWSFPSPNEGAVRVLYPFVFENASRR